VAAPAPCQERKERGTPKVFMTYNGQQTGGPPATWSFSGSMSSALGYDPYDFDASNRGVEGETLTWIGRHRPFCKDKPFNINLPGSLGLSSSGTINGKSTCKECKKK
jgi:hypothetical protein